MQDKEYFMVAGPVVSAHNKRASQVSDTGCSDLNLAITEGWRLEEVITHQSEIGTATAFLMSKDKKKP